MWRSLAVYSASYQAISNKLCVLMHLVHTGNSPSYLSDLVTATANIPSRIHLRSARTHRYEPLTTQLKFGERCFSHAGAKALNRLPHAIQEITDSTFSRINWIMFLFEHVFSTLQFCMGAGVVKSHGKPHEREQRPPFIPWECWERDWLLRESRGTGSKRRSPPAGAGVTPGSLVGLLLLLFGLYLSFLMCVRFYAAWYELRT